MAAQPIPDPTAGNPFAEHHPKAKSWSRFLAQQQQWFKLHLSFGKELASVKGPSDYWDWLLKHAEIIPEAIDRDRLTCRPITVASRPPVTYNPDWVSDQLDRSTDIEFIKRLHSRMLDQSLTEFVTQESDRDVAARLVEFWTQHLVKVIGDASQVLEDHVSTWRERKLREVTDYLRRRWPRTTWANNNAPPEFWRTVRGDFESLGKGEYVLIWTSVPPRALRGELLESQYTWARSPDEGSRARFSAIAKRAAIALGYKSDDGWYEEIRTADFVRFELTGSGHQKDDNGAMILVESGPLTEVWEYSITLTHLLEADSESKQQTRDGSKSTEAEPERSGQAIPFVGVPPGGLSSGFAAGQPTLETSDTAEEQILNLLQHFPELRSVLGDTRGMEQKLDELLAFVKRHPDAVTRPSGAVGARSHESEILARAARRQAVVNPILEGKDWTRGQLVTAAGLGKNSIYDYLDGTRAKITDENRKAIADALGIRPEQLPD